METQLSHDQVIDYLSRLPVMELAGLMHELEMKWGVSAVPNIISTDVPMATGTGHQDQTEFEIQLTRVDPGRKIDAIKAVREITGLGLKLAKDFVEEVSPGNPRSLKTGLSKIEAEDVKSKIEAAGALASII